MNIKNQKIGAWCVPLAMVLLGFALITLAKFIPPLSPSLTADEVAAAIRSNAVGIRIGMIIFMFCGTLLVPITAIFAEQIKRIEGKASILTYTQIITGTIALVLFIPPAIIWSAAAYRPEMSAENIRMLHDLGWFFFIMTVPPGVLQVTVLGIAILQDKRRDPLFPRWVGFLNIWAAILFLPSCVVCFFKAGPFAWNGLIAFWLPVIVFGAWWWLMFFMCLKAIAKPDEQPQSAR